MSTADIRKKLALLGYDMDTFLGINNEGELVFKAGMEYTDHLAGGANIWNGQDSVLFVNERLAFQEERAAQYRSLRQSGALSYAKVKKMFDDHQSVYPERIWNEDGRFSYEVPALEGGKTTYLPDFLGNKKHQRDKFLFEAFWYFDSKHLAGDALSSVITVRSYAKANVTLTPYQDLYVTCKFGSYPVQARTTRGVAATLVCPVDTLNDTETYFYAAERLSDIGDISGLKPGLVDISAGTKLRRLKVGDSDLSYENTNLKTLTLGNNRLIQVIDARGSVALGTGNQKSVDASGCTNVEEIYFDRTAVTGVVLPVGGILKKLHLPATVTNITIRNQKMITEFVCAGYTNVNALRLENSESTAVSSLAMLNLVPAGCHVRITGFYWEAQDAQEIGDILDMLDTMQGIDIDGQGRDISVNSCINTVSGTIHTESLTGAEVAAFNARYPYITISADMTTSFRRYHDEDGALLKTVECHDGVPQSGPPTGMSKANSADGHYSYTFAGWSKTQGSATPDDDALDNVIADRDLYAVYTATVRTYTATWKNSNGTVLETDENVPWGTTPTYNGATPQNPTSGGGSFTAWTPAPGPITGDTNYIATYTPVYNVYFYNGSTLLDTVQVLQDGSATYAGATPVHPTDPSGYIFNGWSPSPTNVQGNLSVYAQWRANVEAPTATDATGAYGVEWDYSNSSPALTRKGLAASFTDPSPAEGVSGNGSSPFDNILPWSGMKRYNVVSGQLVPDTDPSFDEEANDTVVYIPEFYYTAYKDTTNSKWLWAVSPTAKEGYCKHPGSGRYIGRFHTGGTSSGVYSKSGVAPLANTSQTDFRTYSAAKGAGWRMMDLAAWSAIQLLYLVEFAHFDSQTKLGGGWNTGSVGSMGGTGSALYHTVKATGAHNQYRWIEDPFSNVRDWIDGFIGSKSSNCFAAANSSYTGTKTGLNDLGFRLPAANDISGFGYSEYAPWAFIPNASTSDSSYATYVCDQVNSNTSAYPASVGGCIALAYYGLFYFSAGSAASNTNASLGSRLLYKP